MAVRMRRQLQDVYLEATRGDDFIEHTKDRRQHCKREPATRMPTSQPTGCHTGGRVQVGRASLDRAPTPLAARRRY